jgi:hypothetical protein
LRFSAIISGLCFIGEQWTAAMAVAAKIGTAARGQTTHAWAAAALACMGVVFGDIGTSPLYTLSVAAKVASPAGTVAPDAVLGIVSLIFWSLIIVISIKYAILIMRADGGHPRSSRIDQPPAHYAEPAARRHGRHRFDRGLPTLRRRRYHAGHLGP